jgi:excreted virulence factor EspC (type VII ESX diderm)
MAGDGDGFEVVAEELDVHAGRLDGIAQSVEQAYKAANTVRLGPGAYGQLCQFVPALIDPFERDSAETLGQAAQALRDSAARLREAVHRYTATDGRAAGSFRGLAR